MLKILLSATMLLQMYALDEKDSRLLQGLALLPLLLTAILVIVAKMERVYSLNNKSLLLCFLVPIQSLFVIGLIYQGDVSYTLMYMMVAACLLVICQFIRIEEMVDVYIFSMIIFAASVFIFDMESVLNALHANIDIGVNRLSSFGNHPNLLGHVFGIAVAFLMYKLFFNSGSKINKVIITGLIGLFCFLLLLTSSRGATLSLIVVCTVFLYNYLKSEVIAGKAGKTIIITSLFFLVLSIFLFKNYEFIITILDLNSYERGFNSGLTGRSGNWVDIINIISSDPWLLILGGGFRSWDDQVYGFSTDSSYLNFLYEFGFFTSLLLFITFLKALFITRPVIGNEKYNLIFIMLLYSVFEGIFARYLIGIGNPASLLIIFSIYLVYSEKNE